MRSFLIWIGVVALVGAFFGSVVAGLVWGFSNHPWWTSAALIPAAAIVSFVVYWLYRSFTNIVDAREMGVRMIWGKEDSEPYMPGSGALFVPWLPAAFKCYLKRYPMDMFDLDYELIKAMSRAGTYPLPGGKDYKSVEVSVESRAYLNFPRERELLIREDNPDVQVCFLQDLSEPELSSLRATGRVNYNGSWLILERTHPLIKILRAGVPTTKPELADRTEEGVTSSVRNAAAAMVWKEANERPDAFQKRVEADYLSVDGALIQMGFRPSGMKLAIKLVDPPQVVKDAGAQAEAAPDLANARAMEARVLAVAMSNEIADRVARSGAPPTKTTAQVEQEMRDSGEYDSLKKEFMETFKVKEAVDFNVSEDRTVLSGPNGQPLVGTDDKLVAMGLALLSQWRGRNNPRRPGKNPGGKGGNPGKPGNTGAANPPSDTPENAAERYFKRRGKYPNWDPLKRSPHD